MRVEWRDGGGRTRLAGVIELGRMMGTDPNLALSVLEGLGRWESGRSAGGMDPQRKGRVRLQDRAGETSSSSSSSSSSTSSSTGTTTTSGGTTTPPKAPKPPPRPPRKNPATSRVATKSPSPPQAQHRKPKARAKPQAKGKGRATPPPQTPSPPPLQDRGRDPYGNVPGVGDTRYVPWAEGGNGGTVRQVTVLGDWDKELDLGEWWVVSQGSNGEGEGGKKGKKGKKRKREKEGGTFRVPGELLFRTREEAEAHLREALAAGDEGDDGDDGDDEGDEGGDKGEGIDKGGEVGGDKGSEKGGAGSKDEPRQPPTTQEG